MISNLLHQILKKTKKQNKLTTTKTTTMTTTKKKTKKEKTNKNLMRLRLNRVDKDLYRNLEKIVENDKTIVEEEGAIVAIEIENVDLKKDIHLLQIQRIKEQTCL